MKSNKGVLYYIQSNVFLFRVLDNMNYLGDNHTLYDLEKLVLEYLEEEQCIDIDTDTLPYLSWQNSHENGERHIPEEDIMILQSEYFYNDELQAEFVDYLVYQDWMRLGWVDGDLPQKEINREWVKNPSEFV